VLDRETDGILERIFAAEYLFGGLVSEISMFGNLVLNNERRFS
jgi:hypothetical protein